MSLGKRIVILSEVNGNAKGYITFFNGASELSGELRASPLASDATLALIIDGLSVSYDLKKGQNIYAFRVPNVKKIDGEISAIIKNDEVTIFGSTAENRQQAYIDVLSVVSPAKPNVNNEPIKTKPEAEPYGAYDVGEQVNADSISPKKQGASVLSNEGEEKLSQPFYKLVEEQVTLLMQSNPSDEILERLVVDSKWAKIACEDELSYSLGVIKEEGKVKYICYAIPSQSGFNPPNHLAEYCQWLPLSANENEKNGFLVMYQNAENGENLKLNF